MLIYKFTNKTNNKVYIGESRQSAEDRYKNYKNDVKWVKNPRPIIKALRKYGLDGFLFEVLVDNIPTETEMDRLETYYIKEYKSYLPEFGYNIELGGNGIGKHAEETKRKIGLAQIGSKNHMYGIKGKNNKSSKKVIDITTGEIYDSVTLAASALGLGDKSITKIAANARGAKTSAYGHIFRYVDENNNPIFVEIPYNIKNIQPIQDTLTLQVFNTEQEAAEAINTSKTSISQVLSGKRNSCFGHTFIKLESKSIKIPNVKFII